jgi:hypothetical protein
MLLSLKELIVVLLIAAAVFHLGKPIALAFMSESDFLLRRNAWLIITSASFLAPNYWIYALVAVPVLVSHGRRDSNPCALYLFLLYVVPPIPVTVPMIGLSFLFNSTNFLMLSFCVVAPATRRLLRSSNGAGLGKLGSMDVCLLVYGLLHAYCFIRVQAPTGELISLTFTGYLRNVFVFFFTLFVPYFFLSRAITTARALSETMACFCLACALMAGISVFEASRHWLLYGELWSRWGSDISVSMYVSRGDSLRAMASSGHSLALGICCAIAFGFWMFLSTKIASVPKRLSVGLLLWCGLIAAFSRGPWIGAVIIYFLFAALGPKAVSRVFKAASVAIISVTLLSFTPVGERIINVIPYFGGTVDIGNVLYRQRLAERTLQIVSESPFFGDREAIYKMQDLRQGQGIIDIINGYSQILLDCGFVGLSLLASLVLMALRRSWREKNWARRNDAEFMILGASLIACLISSLILIYSDGVNEVLNFAVLPALCIAYARCGERQRGVASARTITVLRRDDLPTKS